MTRLPVEKYALVKSAFRSGAIGVGLGVGLTVGAITEYSNKTITKHAKSFSEKLNGGGQQ